MAHRIKKQTKKTAPQRPRWQKKVIRFLWLIALIGIIGIALLFTFISFQDLPSFEDLENPDFDLATTVYFPGRQRAWKVLCGE